MEEWISKMWYIYTMEYYSAIKINEFMKLLGKWVELENIIVSEVTQSQKITHAMHSLISGYSLRSLKSPRHNSHCQMMLKKKNKEWILLSFLEEGTKFPQKEIQRQSVEKRLRERPSSEHPT